MPESVDNTKPGVIEVSQGAGITNVKVERASHQVHVASPLLWTPSIITSRKY